VNCMQSRDRVAPQTPLPHSSIGPVERDRGEAVRHLQAAEDAEDAAERRALRRLAAELLLPRHRRRCDRP
jgi:hypothetical protein